MRPLLLLALLISAPALAQDAPPARPLSAGLADLRLATAVRLALATDPRTRPLDLEVGARDGVVAVVGIKDAAYQRVAAGVARGVRGVRAVQGLGDESDAGVAAPVSIPAMPQVHVVERGDTLFGIARRYSLSVETLRALNDLRSDNIRVGQRLRLR